MKSKSSNQDKKAMLQQITIKWSVRSQQLPRVVPTMCPHSLAKYRTQVRPQLSPLQRLILTPPILINSQLYLCQVLTLLMTIKENYNTSIQTMNLSLIIQIITQREIILLFIKMKSSTKSGRQNSAAPQKSMAIANSFLIAPMPTVPMS